MQVYLPRFIQARVDMISTTREVLFIARLLTCLALLLTSCAAAADPTAHTFSYNPPDDQPTPTSVHVAGTFNDWSADATPLTRGEDGAWSVTVDLADGLYHYKFIIDGEHWLPDPLANPELEIDDTFGGVNSGVKIPEVEAFTFRPAAELGEVRSVHLAGSFNGWSKDATPMQRGDDGAWTVALDLPAGVHYYKFVVNGDNWLTDPRSDRDYETDDGHGGMNSARLVGFDVRKLGPALPDHIQTQAVLHDPTLFTDRSVASPTLLVLSVRVQAGDITAANVLINDGKTGRFEVRRVPLMMVGTERGLDRYKAVIEVEGDSVQYMIELIDGETKLMLPSEGQEWIVDMTPTFQTPDWAKHAVWYQVFPERFRNGEESNDPGDFEYENLIDWTSDWWDTQPGEARGGNNFYQGNGNVWKRRYGGDLQGLQQKLPYLRELGINALYLNPIFEAESMHKYDTADYRHVDDNFGVKRDTPFVGLPGETDDPATWKWTESDKVFLAFLDEAHKQGFKVVIDGVFNHVGTAHPFFQDVLKHGQQSRYADWFDITDWGLEENVGKPLTYGKPGGIQWAAWDQPNGSLPNFKKDGQRGLAPGPYQHIMDITARWMDPNGDGDPSDGIDGWRLDVPGDIPHPFWIEWRKHVKAINADAYITGEIWQWAHPWLQGDQFDAVMNYQFAMTLQDFFVDQQTADTPTQFAARLTELAYGYPLQVALVNQNLIDSHDTDRFASMFANPDRPYDGENRLQDNGPSYSPRMPDDNEWRRMRQAVAFQMSFVGAPMIYYGTEAGMWSPDDPSNRMPMVWEDLGAYDGRGVAFNRAMFSWYQKCIAVRNELEVLRTGAYRTVLADDAAGVVVYERMLGDQRAWVVINRSDRRQQVAFNLPDTLEDQVLVDVLSPRVGVTMDPNAVDARPTLFGLNHAERYQVNGGSIELAVPEYGVAILVDVARLAE